VVILVAVLLCSLLSTPMFADVDDPPGSAARLSVLQGNVSLLPGGATDWSQATVDYPVTTGDRLYTDHASRARRNRLRRLNQVALQNRPQRLRPTICRPPPVLGQEVKGLDLMFRPSYRAIARRSATPLHLQQRRNQRTRPRKMGIRTTNTEQFRGKGQAPKIPPVPCLLSRVKARCEFACPLTPSSLRTALTFSLRL